MGMCHTTPSPSANAPNPYRSPPPTPPRPLLHTPKSLSPYHQSQHPSLNPLLMPPTPCSQSFPPQPATIAFVHDPSLAYHNASRRTLYCPRSSLQTRAQTSFGHQQTYFYLPPMDRPRFCFCLWPSAPKPFHAVLQATRQLGFAWLPWFYAGLPVTGPCRIPSTRTLFLVVS